MINKKVLIFAIIIIILNFKTFAQSDVFIAYKVNNEIITNLDIKNESRYLIALNNQLKNLPDEQILKIAKESIVREKIKKIELIKYYNLDQKNPFIDKVIKNFYLKLKLNNRTEFEEYLNNYGLTINDVKKKIEIESSWNQLIYDRYNNQININEKKLKKRIEIKKASENKISYLLSEIIFEKNTGQSLDKKEKLINESIKEIGFKNTANIYSVSDSSKFGGDIGWIEKEKLSSKLTKTIKDLMIGEHTKPILIGNAFLILKLENTKKEKIKIDEKKELNKLIIFEQNRQLAQFSKIYFNKIKINTNISEL